MVFPSSSQVRAGVGSLKVRADSEAEAREDAVQMDPDDIEWDSHDIKVLSVEEVE